MLDNAATKGVQSLKLLAQQTVSKRRANEVDLAVFQDAMQKPNCPEYNDYKTALTHIQGKTLQPKTKAIYLPLVDIVPFHPDTIMSAMAKAQRIAHSVGQNFVFVFAHLR
jgi:hypothetical protein